jgi:hypothetical protein
MLFTFCYFLLRFSLTLKISLYAFGACSSALFLFSVAPLTTVLRSPTAGLNGKSTEKNLRYEYVPTGYTNNEGCCTAGLSSKFI